MTDCGNFIGIDDTAEDDGAVVGAAKNVGIPLRLTTLCFLLAALLLITFSFLPVSSSKFAAYISRDFLILNFRFALEAGGLYFVFVFGILNFEFRGRNMVL